MKESKGQTLVILLIFIVIATTITSAAVVLIFNSSTNASKLDQSTQAYYVAESGVENGLMQLLRNPSYSGEVMSIANGAATILVSGTNPTVVTSTGQLGNFTRKIQVNMSNVSGVWSVSSWKEIQ